MSFKNIGLKIQIAREEKMMSQEQLARALGCSQSALSNYEKGKRRLYLSQLEILSQILGKPLEYFVEGWTPDNTKSLPDEHYNNKVSKLLDYVHQLNAEQVDEVIYYIEFLKWKHNRRGN